MPRAAGVAASVTLPPGVRLLLPAPPATLAQLGAVLNSWVAQAVPIILRIATKAGRKLVCDSLKAAEVLDLMLGALGIESGALATALAALIAVAIEEIKRLVGC